MRRIYLLLSVMLGLAGCASESPMPQIVYEAPSATIPAPKLAPVLPTAPPTPSGAAPRSWVPSRTERAWSAIVIHHSATDIGNVAIIDKWHRDNGWNGVGYDFVIGNGSNSGDGEVEPTYRWRGQLTGAHTGGTPGNWANEEAIGICLIGDFNRSTPSQRQMDSLVRLVRFLQQRYGIPRSRIYGHGSTPGGHSTDCPGRRFPMSGLKSNL